MIRWQFSLTEGLVAVRSSRLLPANGTTGHREQMLESLTWLRVSRRPSCRYFASASFTRLMEA